MSKYEICCNDYNSFLTAPSKADQFAMMALSLPDVHTVTVEKRIVSDPQLAIGIQVGNTPPIIIGGRIGRAEEKYVRYTIHK